MSCRSSVVRPELESMTTTSPGWTKPKSPCKASVESRKHETMARERNMATALRAMMPDLPTPVTTTFPAVSIALTAWMKFACRSFESDILDARRWIALASRRSVDMIEVIVLFSSSDEGDMGGLGGIPTSVLIMVVLL